MKQNAGGTQAALIARAEKVLTELKEATREANGTRGDLVREARKFHEGLVHLLDEITVEIIDNWKRTLRENLEAHITAAMKLYEEKIGVISAEAEQLLEELPALPTAVMELRSAFRAMQGHVTVLSQAVERLNQVQRQGRTPLGAEAHLPMERS